MNIYLVNREASDYSHNTYVVGAFDSKEKAENYILEKKKQFIVNREIAKAYRSFNVDYNQTHPFPVMEGLRPIEKWAAGLNQKDITQEMKDERKATIEHNKNISQLRMVEVTKYDQLRRQAGQEYLTKEFPDVNSKLITLAIACDLDCDHDDSKFFIVEMELQ